MHYNIYNWLVNTRILRACNWIGTWKQPHLLQVSSLAIVLFCLDASQLNVQYSAYNYWHRQRTSNTNSYSISNRSKQVTPLQRICHYKHTRKICWVSAPGRSTIPCLQQYICKCQLTKKKTYLPRTIKTTK